MDYVGWHYYLIDTGKVVKLLRASNKRGLNFRLKRMRETCAAGEMELDAIMRSLASYILPAIMGIGEGDTWYLRQRVLHDFVFSRDPEESQVRP